MIHAIQIHEHGEPEVLRYEEVDIPEPGSGQVRLRQTASGVNFLDIYLRKGDFTLQEMPFMAVAKNNAPFVTSSYNESEITV